MYDISPGSYHKLHPVSCLFLAASLLEYVGPSNLVGGRQIASPLLCSDHDPRRACRKKLQKSQRWGGGGGGRAELGGKGSFFVFAEDLPSGPCTTKRRVDKLPGPYPRRLWLNSVTLAPKASSSCCVMVMAATNCGMLSEPISSLPACTCLSHSVPHVLPSKPASEQTQAQLA